MIYRTNELNTPNNDQTILMNKLAVKNAISRNRRISVSQKLVIMKSYEDAIKNDKSSVIKMQNDVAKDIEKHQKRVGILKILNRQSVKNIKIVKQPKGGKEKNRYKIKTYDPQEEEARVRKVSVTKISTSYFVIKFTE